MDNDSGDVDFDFFETPRDKIPESSNSKHSFETKPPNPIAHKPKHDGDRNGSSHVRDSRNDDRNNQQRSKTDYSDDSYSDFESESEKSTPRNKKKQQRGKSSDRSSLSESSSAYSNSDYSSDENQKAPQRKKEKIAVHMPKAQEAWSQDFDSDEADTKHVQKNNTKNRHDSSSDSESDTREKESYRRKDRAKSAKKRQSNGQRKRTLKSSGSFSNNSDITDVSPLESPENSPRGSRKHGKRNVQYEDLESPASQADIKLESEEIDLSILMKCMADIDREKQERLKTNSRRVMFAPPTMNEKKKGNYSFSDNRAKMIEKENQRLLKQIMMNVNSGSGNGVEADTFKGPRKPKRATEPVIQRLTPSAVNRMREQRRIESENMVSNLF